MNILVVLQNMSILELKIKQDYLILLEKKNQFLNVCYDQKIFNFSAFVTTMMKQVRDYVVYDPNITLMCSFATISAVSGSDWLNGIIQANTVGEIIALFPHQILQIPDIQKVLKPKRMVIYKLI